MCATCKEVRRRIGDGGLSQQDALQLLGDHAKLSLRSAKHFDALIDELLGIQAPKDEVEIDEAWERARRG